jgi:hypothetical protein
MPYICLANAQIPDGIVQILDLYPNESLRTSQDPPGQTRYVNRVQNDTLLMGSGFLQREAKGLAAYLADRLEPGGLEYASAVIDMVTVADNNELIIGGVTFTANNGAADYPNQIFSILGGDDAAAADLADCINANAAYLLAQVGVELYAVTGASIGSSLGASVGASGVEITAQTPGQAGALSLEVSLGAGIVLYADHLERDTETFTSAQLNAVATGIISRMDNGLGLQVADINTVVQVVPGMSTTSIASLGTGIVLTDILSILAGRGYVLPINTNKHADASYIWNTTADGSFTDNGIRNDTQMLAGELRPLTIGGDSDPREHKAIRYTVDGGNFNLVAGAGSLSVLAGINPITAPPVLWPDSDGSPHLPWAFQPVQTFTETQPDRLVTVYYDNGEVLS